MEYVVAIDHDTLIDALEHALGDVYEHIQDGDRIEKVVIGYSQVFITIGIPDEKGKEA